MLVGIPPYFATNRDELFNNIKTAQLKFPKHVSEVARSLIRQLMVRETEGRLGAKNGTEDIKSHPFFSKIDWKLAIER
jgi:serine/threonine protein kinase